MSRAHNCPQPASVECLWPDCDGIGCPVEMLPGSALECCYCGIAGHNGDNCPTTFTPITDCEHKDADDGCCHHPKNTTPECHVGACPRLHRRIYDAWAGLAKSEKRNREMSRQLAALPTRIADEIARRSNTAVSQPGPPLSKT